MDQATLNEILKKHKLWLRGNPNGECANLEDANLEGVHLKDVDLACADLVGANLEGADLEGTRLESADLEDANLRTTNLKNANLRHASLRHANLRHADLSYANLEDARLRHAHLEDASLICANLRYADLEEVRLKDTFLTQTISQNIKGQKVISVQVDTSRVNNAISYWKDLGVWTTGCFQGTLEELQEKVAKTHKDHPFLRERYERAIAFILNEAEQNDKKRLNEKESSNGSGDIKRNFEKA